MQKFSGWRTLWPFRKLAEKIRALREMIQECDNEDTSAGLAWLHAWILEEAPVAAQRQQQTFEPFTEIGETATLPIPNDNELAWQSINTNAEISRYDFNNTLPSASLDISQLNDWFGTDLNTSTFDFDGNLQAMIQFFD